MGIHISSAFEAGNIEVVDASEPSNVRLRIRADVGDEHFQWFYFRVSGARGQALGLTIENAGQASYPDGWKGYRACVSVDQQAWTRVDTLYDGQQLNLRFVPEADVVWVAYFAPFTMDRHACLIAQAQAHPEVSVERLGSTLDGRDLDLLRIGAESAEAKIWVIARQHPGETMAEWLVEGLLERLLDDLDPVSVQLRRRASWYIVPNMNPDGSFRGHLRTNAVGRNLNRAWAEPKSEDSPEVLYVRQAMEACGVSAFLDVHGDEAIPHNFVAGAEGTPSWNEDKARRQRRFAEALVDASPDFQTVHGYPVSPPGRANMTVATNWVAERFGCLALTLEQPFKDADDNPRPEGWSPARAQSLGRAVLSAFWAVRSDWSR